MPGVEAAIRVEIAAAAGHAQTSDHEGRWWPAGALARAMEEAERDDRLAFLHAVPRSVAFGRRLAGLAAHVTGRDAPSDTAMGAAEAINAFVTVLDGLCDETPDRLPLVLPDLRARFARFPGVLGPPAPSGSATADLATGLMEATTRTLAPHLAAAPDTLAAEAARAVRAAFDAQLADLRDRGAGARERLSAATFAATLRIVAVVDRADPTHGPILDHLARTSGALFGWIDDVADEEEDRLAGRPNACTELLAREGNRGRPELVLQDETRRRWRAVAEAVPRPNAPCSNVMIGVEAAALAWLGVHRIS